MSSVTPMTTPPSCARNVRCITANWSPRGVARIPIGMVESKSAEYFIRDVRSLLSHQRLVQKHL